MVFWDSVVQKYGVLTVVRQWLCMSSGTSRGTISSAIYYEYIVLNAIEIRHPNKYTELRKSAYMYVGIDLSV